MDNIFPQSPSEQPLSPAELLSRAGGDDELAELYLRGMNVASYISEHGGTANLTQAERSAFDDLVRDIRRKERELGIMPPDET